IPAKVVAERASVNTPLPKKAITTSPVTSRSVRKALGNVNKTEGDMNRMDKIKQKHEPCTVNKVIAQIMLLPLFMTNKKTGLESCHTVVEEDWPEIEKIFPLHPEDFESFDFPEEDRLSNINLCGVPLMVYESRYDRCVNMVPSPVKIEEISWESNYLQSTDDFLATLDEIIDLPP
ncbi:PTTG1 protein, partial [Erythrocercus mccallii]|nr:PTTG1 protein [Erythrocercus mccallii]